MRVLPCLALSGVHIVQPLASKPHQPIAYSSFHPTPPSILTATLSYPAEFADIASEYTIDLRFAENKMKLCHTFILL
jgi:hypothetical protein